jgi:hypothetical protein
MYTIRDNLLRAIELVEGEPDRLFSLFDFERETTCGTLHCTLGLIASDPNFEEQNIRLDRGTVLVDERLFNYEALNSRFGLRAFARLFEARGHGAWDNKVFDLSAMDDKELALWRLRRQLMEYPDAEE